MCKLDRLKVCFYNITSIIGTIKKHVNVENNNKKKTTLYYYFALLELSNKKM